MDSISLVLLLILLGTLYIIVGIIITTRLMPETVNIIINIQQHTMDRTIELALFSIALIFWPIGILAKVFTRTFVWALNNIITPVLSVYAKHN